MIRKTIITTILLCFSWLCSSLVLAGPDQQLLQLADEYWAGQLRENPLKATYTGIDTYNHLLPTVTPADQQRRLRQARRFLQRLQAIDRAQLSDANALNAGLLAFILEHQITLAAFNSWRVPLTSDEGFHLDLNHVASITTFKGVDDYESYLQRLQAVPTYYQQHLANMRLGLQQGFTQPRPILQGMLASFEAQLPEDFRQHPLYAPFNNFPAAIPAADREPLRKRADALFANTLQPVFAEALRFFRQEYMPAAVDKVGVLHLQDGEAYYRALVRFYTTLDDATPERIHQLGLGEVGRIRQEMLDLIEALDFQGDFAEFQHFLRTDPQFYARSAHQLLAEAAWIAKDAEGRLPGFFGKLPRQPYSVEAVPAEIAENFTIGRYVQAPLSGSVGGQYWVNTYALEKRPLYQLTALSLHEAVPGHHLQIALAKEIEGVPAFRRDFYPHAFGEGWGLYAEKLGVEMGVYRTPYEHFGRLSYEMWRACRLVIDTGIHAQGWSRQQAIDYLAANTALSEHNVRTEVDRYISWPGQALAYKMGELTIWELRALAEKELAEKFDIRNFHDAVLAQGGLPLELLRQQIKRYIARQKS